MKAHSILIIPLLLKTKKKNEFANNYDLYNFIKTKAAENGIYIFSNPPPLHGALFKFLIH